MIKHLALENWRSHYKTELDFGSGTNVIIGINGAGKSSVLEAIFFALFGPPEKGYYSKVLREGATSGKVILKFEVNGKEYVVTREFTAKGQKAVELRGAKTIITDRAKDVDVEIARILGMDQKTFKEAVYARQNEIAYILRDASPQERKRLFDGIIEMSDFGAAKQIVTKLRNRIRRELEVFHGQNWEETRKKKENAIVELEKRRKAMERQIAELKEKMQAQSELLNKLQSKLPELEAKAKELANLRQRAAGLRKSLEEREVELKGIEDKWGKIEEVSENDLHNIEERIRKIQEKERQKAALEREIHVMLEHAESLKKQLVNIPKAPKNDEALQAKIKELEERAETLRKKTSEIQAEIASEEEAIRQITSRKAALEKELNRARAVERTIQEITRKYGDVETRLRKTWEEIEQATADMAKYRIQIEQERTFLSALDGANKCPVCGSKLDGKKVKELLIKHKKSLNSAETAIHRLGKRIQELKALATELQDAQRKMQELRRGIRSSDEVTAELRTIEEEVQRRERRIAKLRESAKNTSNELKRIVEALDQTRKDYDDAVRTRAALKEAERIKLELKQLEKNISHKKMLLEELQRDLSRENIEALKEEENRIREMIRAAEISAKMLTERGELEAVEEKIRSLEGIEEEFRRALADVNRTEEKLRSIRQLLQDYQAQAKYIEKDLQREREELKHIVEQLEIAQKKETLKTNLEKLESALSGTQEVVRNARILAINKVLNIIWREIYPSGDLPEIRLRPTQNDYILEVKRKSGQWIPVTNLSGGEFYDTALALRIAISAIKNRNLGWLLLDEPTHNLDSDAAEALAHFLNKLPDTGLFKQIIIITHDETFRTAATATTYIFTRDKTRGSPTKVEIANV